MFHVNVMTPIKYAVRSADRFLSCFALMWKRQAKRVKRRNMNIRATHQNGMFHVKLTNTEKRAEMTSHCVLTASMFHVNLTNEKNMPKTASSCVLAVPEIRMRKKGKNARKVK